MLLKFASTLLLLLTLTFASHSNAAFCQSDEQSETAITAKAISKLIAEKKLDQAVEMIDAGLEKAGPKVDIALLRMRWTVAKEYGSAREFEKSYVQGEKHIRAMTPLQSGAGGISSLNAALSRTLRHANRLGKSSEGLALAMGVLAQAEKVTAGDPRKFITAMKGLVPNCAAQAVANDDEELANKILDDKIAALDALKIDDKLQIEYLITKTDFLKSRARLPSSLEGPAADLKKFIDEANAAHPDSLPLLNSYMRAETFMIGEMLNNYPHEAKARVEALRELVGARVRSSMVLRSMPGTLRSLDIMIGDVLVLEQMIGTKAAEFEVEAWINGGEKPLESLKGKVILLDFWAVWCGPCIEAFPHMVELQKEFGDDGLAVLGVTQRYDYRWNDEKKSAAQADDEVPAAEEIEDIKKFVAHHQLNYPVIVTPEDGTMSKNFAAAALPHVVIIDREGKIQLARVGAGKGAFEQIEKKLKEVLEK